MRLTRAALVAVLALAIAPAVAHADVPTATTTSVTPGATTATVTGTIGPNGQDVSYWVRWDLDGTHFCDPASPDFTQPADFTPAPLPQLSASDPPQTVSVTMTGLTPGHTYCAELVVENNSTNKVIDPETPQTFTELSIPPSIGAPTSSPASPISESVGVTITPNDLSITDSFVYDLATSPWCTSNGASGSPSFQLDPQTASTGGVPTSASATLSNLTQGQTYCWGVQATNSIGSTTAVEGTFLVGLPLATTSAPTAVSTTTATLNAIVDPEGNATNYTFDYAPSSDPFCSGGAGNPKVTGQIPVGASDTNDYSVSAAIANLAPATSYCFEVAASNAVGVTTGGLMTFTTAGSPLGGTSAGGTGGTGASGGPGSSGTGGSGTKPAPGTKTLPKLTCSIVNTSATVILKKRTQGRLKIPLDSIVVRLTCSQTSSATLAGSFSAKVGHKTTTFQLPARRLPLRADAGKAVTIRIRGGALRVLLAHRTLTATLKLTATDKEGARGTAGRSFKLHGRR